MIANFPFQIVENLLPSSNSSVYEYLFVKNEDNDKTLPQGGKLSGELKYLFGYGGDDTLLNQRMMTLWTSFAKTG